MFMDISINAVLLGIAGLMGALSLLVLLYQSKSLKFYTLPLFLNIFVTTLWVLMRFLIDTGLLLEVPHLFRTTTPLAVLAGPTVYLYVRGMIRADVKWQKTDLLHLLPGVVVFLLILPFYLKSSEEKYVWLTALYEDPSRFGYFLESVLPAGFQHIMDGIIVIVYGILALQLIANYTAQNPEGSRRIPKGTLRWMRFHSAVIISLGLVGVNVWLFQKLPRAYFVSTLNTLAAILEFPLLLFLFFNPSILYGDFFRAKHDTPPINSNSQNQRDYGLTTDQIQEISEALALLMKVDKPYLNKDFNLDQLAGLLGVSRHQISYILNQKLQTNFWNYINDLRISYCMEQLNAKDWTDLSIDGISDKAGFGSRGTFIKAFKKKTGNLPSEFRRELLD